MGIFTNVFGTVQFGTQVNQNNPPEIVCVKGTPSNGAYDGTYNGRYAGNVVADTYYYETDTAMSLHFTDFGDGHKWYLSDDWNTTYAYSLTDVFDPTLTTDWRNISDDEPLIDIRITSGACII